MQMEYSADDVEAARSLQLLALSVDGDILSRLVAVYPRPPLNLLIQTYDYACSLHEEWKFLHRSRWTKVKALYIITRYVPVFLITTDLLLNFTLNENLNVRELDNTLFEVEIPASVALDQSKSPVYHYTLCPFFSRHHEPVSELHPERELQQMPDNDQHLLRTNALWNNSRILLVATLSAVFIRFTAIATSQVTTSTIPGITSCHWSSQGVRFFMSFILLLVFQLGLVSLTLIRVIQSWRTAKSHLHAVLVKHNILYYACGLFVDVPHTQSAYYYVFEEHAPAKFCC
ncbi:hypothetical protein EDB19DRAFT_1829277 [Suillus lakei]|nr:hypothetical protein EDB19DRAFT_1829277 [Suillus lakei]